VQKVDGLAKIAEKRLLEERLVRKGDVIGIVAGTPMGIRGTTNFMKFHIIGGRREAVIGRPFSSGNRSRLPPPRAFCKCCI